MGHERCLPQRRLHEYADGRLRGRRLAPAERHLATCRSCREALAELVEVKCLLAEQTTPAPPEGLWERCLLHLTRRPSPPPPRGRLVRPALGLIPALLATGLVLWLRPHLHPDRRAVLAAQLETPEVEYVMQHAEFADSQALSSSSHYDLLTERAEEEESDTDSAPGTDSDANDR